VKYRVEARLVRRPNPLAVKSRKKSATDRAGGGGSPCAEIPTTVAKTDDHECFHM
jgi:hypothetical protein